MRTLLPLLFVFLMGYGCQSDSDKPKTNGLAFDTTAVIQEGRKIARATFQTLNSNLQNAISVGGITHALQFCSAEAIPLTDSLSAHHNVSIRRASHKPRNPYNTADLLEAYVIKKYIDKLESNKELQPVTYANKNSITFHAPIIITNQLCLNCHGQPGKDISESNLATIQELYPEDQATGFSMGELRGVWTIRFPASDFDSANELQFVH